MNCNGLGLVSSKSNIQSDSMKKLTLFSLVIFSLFSCKKEPLSNSASFGLKCYLDSKLNLETGNVIACAGGTTTSFLNDSINPISVFFYVDSGAHDFRYYETNSINVDPNDYYLYVERDYEMTVLFQGIMRKFNHPPLSEERWGIVTYETEGKIHICNPIRLKAVVEPTQNISAITTIMEIGVNPTFDWTAESEPNNVIYFSVVSDLNDQLISGTYTTEKFWTFYDLSNVVLNVTPSPNPNLMPSSNYNYTMMGVSVDNWVHTFATKPFVTN